MPYLSDGSGEVATPTLGESIGKGHAQDDHEEDFAEIDVSREDLPQFIDDVIKNAKAKDVIDLKRGRTAYIAPETETVMIHDPNHPDLDTVFRPRDRATGESTFTAYVEKLKRESKK
ncbi:hypothetical protein [Myxococcus sp. AB056]|uniref:hypothetical protein n=1 Tax=Myxococcus sp. AB056 TaxID=2562792 RepID=UPI0011467664|nr:hypothetical protein [Myxococcus sp. AB056]